jgi:hypothetical protein
MLRATSRPDSRAMTHPAIPIVNANEYDPARVATGRGSS